MSHSFFNCFNMASLSRLHNPSHIAIFLRLVIIALGSRTRIIIFPSISRLYSFMRFLIICASGIRMIFAAVAFVSVLHTEVRSSCLFAGPFHRLLYRYHSCPIFFQMEKSVLKSVPGKQGRRQVSAWSLTLTRQNGGWQNLCELNQKQWFSVPHTFCVVVSFSALIRSYYIRLIIYLVMIPVY